MLRIWQKKNSAEQSIHSSYTQLYPIRSSEELKLISAEHGQKQRRHLSPPKLVNPTRNHVHAESSHMSKKQCKLSKICAFEITHTPSLIHNVWQTWFDSSVQLPPDLHHEAAGHVPVPWCSVPIWWSRWRETAHISWVQQRIDMSGAKVEEFEKKVELKINDRPKLITALMGSRGPGGVLVHVFHVFSDASI